MEKTNLVFVSKKLKTRDLETPPIKGEDPKVSNNLLKYSLNGRSHGQFN